MYLEPFDVVRLRVGHHLRRQLVRVGLASYLDDLLDNHGWCRARQVYI